MTDANRADRRSRPATGSPAGRSSSTGLAAAEALAPLAARLGLSAVAAASSDHGSPKRT